MIPQDIGILHIGGLDNFRSAFGEDPNFYRDKNWYVSSFRGLITKGSTWKYR